MEIDIREYEERVLRSLLHLGIYIANACIIAFGRVWSAHMKFWGEIAKFRIKPLPRRNAKGNAYVTDAKGNKILKIDVNGEIVSTIESPLVALNGIVYHPDGFLIVIHTFSGLLYKIDLTAGGDDGSNKVSVVEVTCATLRFGDVVVFDKDCCCRHYACEDDNFKFPILLAF
ncbi:unnamed protein product [Eruca vesicaria subsp. sativa]|uniref:Uncharacterized protein n=1 Tax=Eruca vesicaria subsp. sativa TaxID=29727 RepID=A0ABC8LGT5_ERUVS|nr:unnamed protein product [Eruca vesicaria subsp. sativa]